MNVILMTIVAGTLYGSATFTSMDACWAAKRWLEDKNSYQAVFVCTYNDMSKEEKKAIEEKYCRDENGLDSVCEVTRDLDPKTVE